MKEEGSKMSIPPKDFYILNGSLGLVERQLLANFPITFFQLNLENYRNP